jgi:predicted RNA-binding Zn-ribbon protein involved in translation (DUF1610 family)
MKILLLDIETAPNLAHVWGLWDQNVGLPQLLDSGYMLCWAAKWYGSDHTMFRSLQDYTKEQMLLLLWDLLDEADAVVHYNGRKFDVPWINSEFVRLGFLPPSPYKQIDLLETVKKQFKFPSNKLEYVVDALGVGKKQKTSGHELWIGCMANTPNAWNEMQAYNIQDVAILEALYVKLIPWVKGHANHGLFSDGTEPVCPNCGGNHLQKRGLTHTLASVYQRYRCTDCGHWSKDNTILNRKKFKTTSIGL